ncbi:MAG: radical SAM protein [Clostridia bacterium]|nr:radical SAM protein [Clostridia bacterium]
MLTRVGSGGDDFFLADWNMNLYRGCSHGCIYCDSRSVCYRLTDFDTIRPKEDALRVLEDELRRKKRGGVVTMGAMSDPYNPLEKELRLTRGALELLLRHGFGAAYTTKSDLCARDADLMQEISRHAPVCARLTVTCADDGLCRRIEPYAAPTSRRLEALQRLADAGVYAGVWINPVLPFITDTEDNLVRLLHMAKEAGARFAVCFFAVTLRTGNREYFFRALERDFPGVRQKYLLTFGNAYECITPDAERLWETYRNTCQRLGLAYSFRDVNAGMLEMQPAQMSMF